MKFIKIMLAVFISSAILVSWTPDETSIVTIKRDTFGTPHIYSETDYGAFFGAGWCQAEDHLEEMLINYKTSRGRASEIFGYDYLELDTVASLLDNEFFFSTRYNELSCEVREMCEGFTDGINEYMRIFPDKIPEWAEPVSPVDPLILARTTELAWTFYQLLGDDANLPSRGSNEWALSPEKSLTGNAFVQADPHLPIGEPFKSALYHLKGETFEFQGPCAFGDPIPRTGQTRNISWALTSNDDNWKNYDIYWMEIANGKYEFDGKWLPLVEREKTLTMPDGETAKIISQFTHFGPVYKSEFGKFAIRIAGWNVPTALDQQLKMLKAKNTDEFLTAMKMQHIPQWNYAFADTGGNIGYLFNALLPYRTWEDKDILDGTNSKFQWKSFIPFDWLPLEVNPECGWVSNCNEPPWFCCPNTTIDKKDNIDIGIYGYQTWRSMRAWNWLDNDEKFGQEKLEEMLMDTEYHYKDDYISWLKESTKETADDPLVKLVLNWDGRFDVDSKPAPYIYGFMLRSYWGEKDIDVAKRLGEVKKYYKETLGKTDVTWGEVNRFKRGEHEFPLNAGPPFLGSLHYHTPTENGYDFGSAFQMLMELSDPPKAWIASPFSQSEDPNSKHYIDGTKLWCEGKLRPAMMDGFEVEEEYDLEIIYR